MLIFEQWPPTKGKVRFTYQAKYELGVSNEINNHEPIRTIGFWVGDFLFSNGLGLGAAVELALDIARNGGADNHLRYPSFQGEDRKEEESYSLFLAAVIEGVMSSNSGAYIDQNMDGHKVPSHAF